MRQTSAEWKALWAAGARLEAVAEIAGAEHAGISAPEIERALSQDGLSIGNAAAAVCRFSVRTDAAIPASARVRLRMRLTDGARSSEWLAAGTYFISHRQRDPVTGLLTLECYDALLKANAPCSAPAAALAAGNGALLATDGGAALAVRTAWPRPMALVAQQIALAIGTDWDARNAIGTGADYMMDEPAAGTTMREVLEGIAAANGGSWIVTPENRLRLVPLASAAGAAEAEEAADVEAVLGRMAVGPARAVTGLRWKREDVETLTGDATGLVVTLESPYATAGIADALAARLIGMTYQPFALDGAAYDPAAELGDYVRAGEHGEVAGVLFSERAALGPAYRGDIGAPEPDELADEYPYIAAEGQALRLLSAEVKTLDENKADTEYVDALDASLDQQGVFDRLTDDGAAQGLYMLDGQLYVNMSFARAGTLQLGGLNDANGLLQVLDAQGNAIGEWSNAGISLSKGSLRFPVSGATGAGHISLNYGGYWFLSEYEYSSGSGTRFYIDRNVLSCDDIATDDRIYFSPAKATLTGKAGTVPGVDMTNESAGSGARTVLSLAAPGAGGHFITCMDTGDNPVYRAILDRSGGLQLAGALTVSGTKNRKADAGEYGARLLYCYETPTPLFGDVGEGVIGADGRCWVALDAVFAQTVDAERCQVFLQKYGEGDCWVRERAGGLFIVEGTPGLRFGWEIKARQKDFSQRRLERAAEPFSAPARDYGGEAAEHIRALQEGRTAA